MRTITFATKNNGKMYFLTKVLAEYGIKVVQAKLELPEPRTKDCREIARQKAIFAFQQLRVPVLVNDGALSIDSLNGFPDTFINYVLETIGIGGILNLLRQKGRECAFRDCFVYYYGGSPVFFGSEAKGYLSFCPPEEMRDYFWSVLELIFTPKNKSKTLAEMTEQECWQWRVEKYRKSFVEPFVEFLLNQ